MRMVALVQTQVLMAIPVPNMENRLIFSTIRLGRFLMVHSGMGLLAWDAMVTLASHLEITEMMTQTVLLRCLISWGRGGGF